MRFAFAPLLLLLATGFAAWPAQSQAAKSEFELFDFSLPSSLSVSGGADSETTRQSSLDLLLNLRSGTQVFAGVDRRSYEDESFATRTTSARFGFGSDPLETWSWTGELQGAKDENANSSLGLGASITYTPSTFSFTGQLLLHRYHVAGLEITSPALNLGLIAFLSASWTLGVEVYRAAFREELSRFETEPVNGTTSADSLANDTAGGLLMASAWLRDQVTLSLGKSMRRLSLAGDLSWGHTAIESQTITSLGLSPSYDFTQRWSGGARLQFVHSPASAETGRAISIHLTYAWR